MEGMFNIFIFVIVFIIGGIFLQIFLSKKENKWFGLILPLICLMMSFIPSLSYVAFQSYSTGGSSLQDGTLILETIELEGAIKNNTDDGSIIFTTIFIFALWNIPTAILFLIYFACREDVRKRKMLDKMNIQDL